MLHRLFSLSVLTACLASCTHERAGLSQASAIEETTAKKTTRQAFAALKQQRSNAALQKYYEDGARVEACWKNPLADKLTDLKKAFYCSFPLEFRLCNTIQLLTAGDDIEKKAQAFVACQKVDAAFGSHGLFVYDAMVTKTYRAIFLDGTSGLTPAEEAVFIAEHKPELSARSFPALVAIVAASLVTEAIDFANTPPDDDESAVF